MITKIRVIQFMRISDVEIEPNGPLVRIEGMNNQGKSSFLKAIKWILGGAKHQPKDHVRHGADEAKGEAHLSVKCPDCDGSGDGVAGMSCDDCQGTGWIPKYIVSREKVGSKYETILKSADSKRIFSSPRKLLDELYKDVGFDPLQFAMMKRKDRDDLFTKLIGLDFTEIDSSIAGSLQARKDQNNEVKKLEGSLTSMADVPDGTPSAEVSVSDLIRQRDEAQQIATDNQLHQDRLAVASGNAVDMKGEIVEMEAALVERGKAYQNALLLVSDLETVESNLPPIPDIKAITTQIDTAEQTNANVRIKLARITTKNSLNAAKAKSEVMTADIEKLRSDRLLMIESADMPLPELSYDYELGVMYDKFPYEQASQSDQIMASCALGFKLNPEKIAIITHGSLLDENRKAEIEAFADKEKGQIFMEVTSDGSAPVGFVIDDGALVEPVEVSNS